MSERAVIVDVGIGNLRSVQKALVAAANEAGRTISIERSGDPEAVLRADRIIMPGQGGFRDWARSLVQHGLAEALAASIKRGTPYFGICLGLQVLFEGSDEAPGEPGLSVLGGRVVRLSSAPGIKVPHMGWNQLTLENGGHGYLEAVGGDGTWVYFVHSFSAAPSDPGVLKASVAFGPNTVTAAVARDNVFATQFHPEKSQAAGLALLRAFLAS